MAPEKKNGNGKSTQDNEDEIRRALKEDEEEQKEELAEREERGEEQRRGGQKGQTRGHEEDDSAELRKEIKEEIKGEEKEEAEEHKAEKRPGKPANYWNAQIRAFGMTLIEMTPLWNALLISLGFISFVLLFPFYHAPIVLAPLALIVFVAAWHKPVFGTIISFVLLLPAIAWQTPIFGWMFLLVISFMLFNVFQRWYMFSAMLAIVGLSFVGFQAMPEIKLYTGILAIPIVALSVFKLGSKRSIFFIPLTIFMILMLSAVWNTESGSFLTVAKASYSNSALLTPDKLPPALEETHIALGESISRMLSWDVMQEVGTGLNMAIASMKTMFFADSGLLQLILWSLVFYGVAWLPLFLGGGKWQQTIPALCLIALIPIHFVSAYISGVDPNLLVIPASFIVIAIVAALDTWGVRITAEEELVAEEKRGVFGLPGLVDLSMQKTGPSALKEVGNYDETKTEITESILMPLRNRELTLLYGIRPPKGILLFGPPGTGKTLLMSALAKELRMPFYYVKCSELLSMWFGESEKNIAAMFKNARKNQPCILFIDEIDSIAKKREMMATDDPSARVLSAMLTEMDGIKGKENIIIVGATNIPATLDPAILRPGRFDKIIYMPAPDLKGRKAILSLYLKKLPLDDDIDLDRIAKMTERYTGADLANLVLEAARQAAPAAVAAKKIIPLKMNNFLSVLKTLKASVTFDMLDDYDKFRVDFERRGVAVSEEPVVEAPQVKWTDVIGLDDVKQTLKEAIELPLLHEEELKKYKVKPAKGVLMFGPPGCGKTMLVRAASSELKATFISLTPADISRRGYDQAVSLIKEVFNRGRENAPAVIFIDEIESIAPARGYTSSKTVEDMVAQMLQELDGMKELKNVVLVGATNRPDIIDKALLRPGRFDKIVFVSPPDKKGRKQIFIKNLDGIDGSDTVDYDKLAELSEGFTGADISGVCQEVKLELVRRKIAGEDEPEATTEALEAVISRRTPSVTVDMLKQYLSFVKEFGERR